MERDASSMLTIRLDDKTIWQVIGAILFTLAALWAVREMSGLLLMLGLAFFFSLALQPAVLWLVERFEWRRGTAVGVIYLTGIVVATLMILVLIPAITELARRIGESGGAWLNSFNTWIDDMLGTHLTNPNGSTEIAKDVDKAIADWARGAGGHVLGVAASGITMVFNLATIAMFTFYFTVDAPRFQRTILSHMSPERQRRVGWTWDEAIRQTGGYFYSRLVLMVINGTGFFFTMVVVGMPVAFAIPLAAFGGFVSVFIPAVGTYIGGAVPIMVTLAIQGWTAGLVVLGYVLIYQQVENYWLSPKISSKSMSING
ncbi:MAG: AI-2E family transporter, partial [Actinomycetota bacterium]